MRNNALSSNLGTCDGADVKIKKKKKLKNLKRKKKLNDIAYIIFIIRYFTRDFYMMKKITVAKIR